MSRCLSGKHRTLMREIWASFRHTCVVPTSESPSTHASTHGRCISGHQSRRKRTCPGLRAAPKPVSDSRSANPLPPLPPFAPGALSPARYAPSLPTARSATCRRRMAPPWPPPPHPPAPFPRPALASQTPARPNCRPLTLSRCGFARFDFPPRFFFAHHLPLHANPLPPPRRSAARRRGAANQAGWLLCPTTCNSGHEAGGPLGEAIAMIRPVGASPVGGI